MLIGIFIGTEKEFQPKVKEFQQILCNLGGKELTFLFNSQWYIHFREIPVLEYQITITVNLKNNDNATVTV